MIDVEVRNFQSIEHATIRVDGFTALVGKSNIGKSALVRAVRAALTGAVGTAFVQHGGSCARRVSKKTKTCDCYCSVHIRTEGFDLLWEKGDKRNKYQLNGESYEVPGRGTPEFLLRPKLANDFGAVKVGDEQKLLQISSQFDNIFLLNQTGGVVADVFSDVARLDRVNVAMRMVEKDRKEAASTRKVREKDMVDLARQLESYAGLDESVSGVARVEKQLEGVSVVQTKVDSLAEYIGEIRDLGYRVDLLEKACAVPAPDISPVGVKSNRYGHASRFLAVMTDRLTSVKKLMGVDEVPQPVIDPVLSAYDAQAKLRTWVSGLQGLQDHFSKFKAVSEAPDLDVSKIRETWDRASLLMSLVSKQAVLVSSIDTLERQYATAVIEEKGLSEEREQLGGYCPTCTQPLCADDTHTANRSWVS